MLKWMRDLDRILRGDATRLPALREGRIDVDIGGLSVVLFVLGLISGGCVGTYSVFRDGGPYFQQLVASTVKLPALFLLTLLVTFPSLYVFNALVGSRLHFVAVLRLLVASAGITLALLSAFGPIVAFFSVSTTNYSFMVLLNVLVFTIAGIFGLKFLLQTLHRLSLVELMPPPPVPPAAADGSEPAEPIYPVEPTGPLDRLDGQSLGRHVKTVFRFWVIVFGLVGAQMSWVLRPFIGNPARPFAWFRPRESNFFEAVWGAFRSLFS